MSLLSARGDEEVMAEINITPFTDVLLVLLIIFMILAALVTPPGFEKQLPNSNNSQSTASKNKNDIQIVVNDKGVIYVDSTKTDTKGIYRVMYETIKKRGKKKISLTSDIKAPYGVIIRILDAAKRAGDENVGFVTS